MSASSGLTVKTVTDMDGVYLTENKVQFIAGFALKNTDNLSEIETKLLTFVAILLVLTGGTFDGQQNLKT